MSKTLEAAIGGGIFGKSYDEAHAEPGIWSHLVEEQDRTVERVKLAMATNGWRVFNGGLDALSERLLEEARLEALTAETYRDAMEDR